MAIQSPANDQASGPFTREDGFSASLKTCSLCWQGFVSDSGMWRDESWL